MKLATVFALFLTSAAAFQQVNPAFRPATSLSITKEEDLELTRKVINDFAKGQTGAAPEPEPEPAKEEKKEAVASKED